MEKLTLDPLELYIGAPHIIDLIFQHLKFHDLKNISTLSRFYEDFISSSSRCMNTFKLHVTDWKIRYRGMVFKRKYQNVSFDISRKGSSGTIIGFLKKKISWKYLEMICNKIDIMNVLYHNQRSIQQVEELKITSLESFEDSYYIRSLYKRFSNVKFDSLKSLELINNTYTIPLTIAMNSRFLTKLSLVNHSSRNIEHLLKKLSCERIFRLEKFQLSLDSDIFNFDRQDEPLLTFLSVHKDSLKEITLHVLDRISVLNLMFSMPELHRLHLYKLERSHEFINWEEVNISISSSIKELVLDDTKYCPKLVSCFLRSCINIESLEIHDSFSEISSVIQSLAPQFNAPSLSHKFTS